MYKHADLNLLNQTNLNQIIEGLRLDAKCITYEKHRHFGFYNIELGNNCQTSKFSRFIPDIGLKLRSLSIPILRPIPQEGIIQLQVVESDPAIIPFNSLYSKPLQGMVPCLLGEKEGRSPFWLDLASNPHMLVVGSTGSGKSVLLHTLLNNLVRQSDVSIYLIDPKQVEFSSYSKNRRFGRIVNEYNDAINLLNFLVKDMEQRYEIMRDIRITSLEQNPNFFNKIVVIIDEINDLLLSDKSKKLQTLLIKLAQKGRAAGIYLVAATQRPSADIINGLVKANFEGRLVCRVTSRVDSQIVLNSSGAELLLGKGDALFSNKSNNLVRVQIAYSSPDDVLKSIKTVKY